MGRQQHAVVKFLSHLGQVWVCASQKPELLTANMMVSVGNVPPLGTKRYPWNDIHEILLGQNSSKIHETWHATMERHQHAVVNFLLPFGAGLGICFSKTRASHNKHDGFGREWPNFGGKMISIGSNRFQIFLVSTMNNWSVVSIFVIFRGSFGHFYALTEFSMHLCA